MLAVLTCSMAHNQIGTPTAPSLHLPSGAQRLYSLQKGDSLTQLKRPDTVQIVEQLWSTRLNRGAAQREGSGTPSAVEWQPLYPALRVPGSNPQSLPELKAFHGLGRVEVPGVALACAPSASTQSAPATSVIVAPGGAYKFVGVPGKPEADSVPLTHPNPDDPDPVEPHPHPTQPQPQVLQWLCATGDVAVFVLKYRVPVVGPPATPEISNFGGLPWGDAALMDAQRAVRLVRWWAAHNQSLKLDPGRVGFLGLSAGAHLVAHLAWRHDERLYARLDAVDEENALPNFQILVYPWNLERLAPSSRWLGVTLQRQPSNASRPLPTFRLRARRDTPPTLLAQELTDVASSGVTSAASYFASLQAEAARASNRTDELHLYNSTGAHGLGACHTQAAAASTARCGTRRSGTLGAPLTSRRELYNDPRHTMCEEWPKVALRFMRRLDFACRHVSM